MARKRSAEVPIKKARPSRAKRAPDSHTETIRQELVFKTGLINNEIASMLSRRNAGLGGGTPDPRRNLNEECGYPETLDVEDYVRMYEREGVACRVVTIFPDECFAVEPNVYETEESSLTDFEEDWRSLCDTMDTNPIHYLHRVDVDSGLVEYGALMLGLPGDPSRPSPGMLADGSPAISRKPQPIRYMRSFNQKEAPILAVETNKFSPRYGRPVMYQLNLGQTRTMAPEGTQQQTDESIKVHWSRVIHAAENAEVRAIPRMRAVFNKLLDVQKILASSAEMFYKGGFPGLSLELDPRILDSLNVDAVDTESIDEEMFNYQNGLQRYIYLNGLTAKSLAPQVANPQFSLEAQLNSIAMSIGAPLRIFMGSEQAQLASGQDVRTWNRRVSKRQNRYLSPMLVRPLVDRLIMLGCVRAPKVFNKNTGKWKYNVWWPDVNMPDEDMKSQIADRRAAAMMKYFASGAWQAMQFRDFLRFVLQLEAEEVAEIMANAKKPPEIKIEMVTAPAPDSGSKGNPPSKPPKGGKR